MTPTSSAMFLVAERSAFRLSCYRPAFLPRAETSPSGIRRWSNATASITWVVPRATAATEAADRHLSQLDRAGASIERGGEGDGQAGSREGCLPLSYSALRWRVAASRVRRVRAAADVRVQPEHHPRDALHLAAVCDPCSPRTAMAPGRRPRSGDGASRRDPIGWDPSNVAATIVRGRHA